MTDSIIKPAPEPDFGAIPKPKPIPDMTYYLSIRLSPAQRDAIRALAEEQNLTLQQLGMYAWNLALRAYGKPSLGEV